MKLSLRLLLSYFLIVGLMTYFLTSFVFSEVKPLLRQSVEETLVDSANMLAEIVAAQTPDTKLAVTASLRTALEEFIHRRPEAGIWTLKKNNVDLHIYVTDQNGIVLFDSRGLAEGDDYSRWNDVYLTLRGHYGARTTRSDEQDSMSSVLYVAAPIYQYDHIIGVVSIGKPGRAIQPFAQRAQRHLGFYGAILLVACLMIGLWFTHWLSSRIRQLREYAIAVSNGQRVQPPHFKAGDEVSDLALAVSQMKDRLEGHSYVEQTVQMLAHEMKSPLTAIQGAGELLGDELEDRALQNLAENITQQSERLKVLINRMLALARVEKLSELPAPENVDLVVLVKGWQTGRRDALDRKALSVQISNVASEVQGSAELLSMAVNNLLDNALEFASLNTVLRVSITQEGGDILLEVINDGERIPEFAVARLFERFYSLARPGTNERGSGLGLAIVRQVAELHGGTITVANHSSGVIARLTLPMRTHTERS